MAGQDGPPGGRTWSCGAGRSTSWRRSTWPRLRPDPGCGVGGRSEIVAI